MKTIECLKCNTEIIMNNTDISNGSSSSHDCDGKIARASEYRIIED